MTKINVFGHLGRNITYKDLLSQPVRDLMPVWCVFNSGLKKMCTIYVS